LDRDKAYEVLGVKPGVSNRDLKAAHRDLAKVWHPDRFLHDPRLQQKAQEKLKEINEAYELLISGKTPQPAPTRTVYSQAQRRRSGSGTFALLVFVAVFAVTTKVLLDRRTHQPVQEPEVVVEQPEQQTESPTEVVRKTAKPNREVEAAPEVATNETVATPTTALATVTVTIDPETGLLAKPECRLRSRMTYPSGSEPTAYCNLSHAPPPKESRVKSIAEKILTQRRKAAKEEP
jgi:DnaJ-like protein